jgi:hypothetical protein
MIFAGLKTTFNVVKSWTVQHSPEILLGTSIAAGIGATVTGCIATKKMEAINEKHREILDILNKEHPGRDDGESSDDNREYRRLVTKEYGRYWLDVAKAWAPCVGLTLASGTAAFGSFKIINKRLIIAETAFAGVSQAFEQYRDNVIEDQGYEKDEYYANNGALKKKQELIAKGKYKEKDVPMTKDPNVKCIDLTRVDDIFHYYYNEDTVKPACYSRYPYYNMRLLCEAQTRYDDNLKNNGIVFLDDIYQYLGLDMKTLLAERAQGRTYGWVLDCYTEDGMPNDQHVLFGIYEYNDTQHRLFRAGQINDIMLHFNCRLLTPETCAKFAKG